MATSTTVLGALQMGLEHHRAGRLAEASAIYQTVLEVHPENPDALHLLGMVAHQSGNHADALPLIDRAIAGMPHRADFHRSKALVLEAMGDVADAISSQEKAIQVEPNVADAQNDLGRMLCEAGKAADGMPHFVKAIELQPDHADAHWNHGLALLLMGDYARGWEEYEWRWKTRDFPNVRPTLTQPLWDGSDLNGKTILLWEEQGYGDAIQFIRYAPLVAQRGGKVIVVCDPPLARLFQSMDPNVNVVLSSSPLPRFDVHCPLGSLPRGFATRVETIPAIVPYLKADPTLKEVWRSRIGDERKLKVGICWEGNAENRTLRYRHFPLSALAPLATIDGVEFYNLRKRLAGEVREQPPAQMKFVDLTDGLSDFADTAALIANLDLVISVDTAVAHLAGALGKPTWTLLPFAPDWRWMLNRPDSPWYPTMKLFRQNKPGQWEDVIDRVSDETRFLANAQVIMRK